jgi:LysM repeat protein
VGWSQKKHTVGPKETLFSIGRLYNVHPRELAEYNNIPFETSLHIGQVIKIPSKTTMVPLPPVAPVDKTNAETKPVEKKEVKTVEKTPAEKKPVTTNLVPVYHVVQKKETLYQISRMFNKVPVADLKKWNNLSSDALPEGTNLVVGYTSSENVPATTTTDQPVVKPVIKEEPVVEKKPEVITPAKPKKKEEPVKPMVTDVPGSDSKEGYFKNLFEAQAVAKEKHDEEGMAGVFKSTSGWNDGKYYCLHNSAAPGTVIKIINTATGKFVYAKVLDVIPDIKQNNGLLIRVSNAAANELGAGEVNFNCSINYSK